METKPLLFGLIGFFLGGLIVSIAATNLDKQVDPSSGMSMSQMTESLKGKQGDDFDKAFITGMIEHHQGAIEMAELAESNAKHDELKKLSREISSAQKAEIVEMKQWQNEWGYSIDDVMQTEHQGH